MRLRLFGLPLHPFLVHFPIAFWLAVPIFDIAALSAGPEPWWGLAAGAALVGLLIGAGAIVAGLLDYLEPSLAGIDLRLAARHGVRTTLAWCAFAVRLVLAAVLSPTTGSMVLCLLVDLIGCALLLHGVYFGTRQVYQQLQDE